MGRLLLVYRLGIKDLRRRPTQAILLLLVIAAGAATLTLGLALQGTTDNPYARTRAATNGPDVVAMISMNGPTAPGPATTAQPGDTGNPAGSSQAAAAGLRRLAGAPDVNAHSGPFPVTWTVLSDGPISGSAEVEGRDAAPAAVDQPKLLQGSWIREGGVVVEAGYASMVGIRLGDPLRLGDSTFRVAGIAVTAAIPAYPNTCADAEGCFLANKVAAHNPGLIWATQADTARIAGSFGPDAYYLNLTIDHPSTAQAFADRYNADSSPTAPYLLTWQTIRDGNANTLAKVRQILVVGSWLLALLAVASVAVLVGGRMLEQTRRVGLLKAVGGTPWLVAAVLLLENTLIAFCAAGLGIVLGWLAAPLVDSPGAGLLGAPSPPAVTPATIVLAIALALGVAIAATGVPAVRAARQSTVGALNDTARAPHRREAVLRLSSRLPVPLLLGVRLTVRRPRRLLFSAFSFLVTVTGLVVVMTFHATSAQWALGPGVTQATTIISALLVLLAGVNITFIAWTTALDTRRPVALVRALGATPGQVTLGLSVAQMIPALVGALLGIPLGIALYAIPKTGTTTTLPAAASLIAVVAATLLAAAVLTALPTRIGALQSASAGLQG